MIHSLIGPDAPRFASDVRISPRVPIAMLATSGVFFGAFAETLGLLPTAVLLIILLEGLAGAAWLLADRRPRVAAWLTIAALAAGVQLTHHWLHIPGTLSLMAVPCALAAALCGLVAAAVAGAGVSALWLVLLRAGYAGASPATVVVALLAVWATLGVMFAVYQPVYQLVGWSWQHYERAQSMLEEARDRRVELKQALADLADANLQLTRLNRLAQGLRQAAEEARQAKEQFVANVSHELRTPLNMIIGFSEMIVQAPGSYGRLPRALLADLNVIMRNTRHLASLVDDVLDLSQIEAGRMALVKERVSLPELIQAAVDAVRPLYASKNLVLETDIAPDLPLVFCDRTRIREVVLNLLSNAGRFTVKGDVCVRACLEGSQITVSVTDTGPGIASQDAGRVFHPFQQLDGSLRRVHGGSGLGLSISKALVELHGGAMWFESEVGHGSTFYVRLPIDPPVSAGDADASRWFSPYWHYEERDRRSKAPLARTSPRFVVLEQGDALQRLVTRYLDGAEAVRVDSLDAAAEELARTPAHALLVNDASVANALQELNGSAALPHGMPAIICSVPGSQQAAASLSIADYLIKPVSQDRLLEALDRLQLAGSTVLIVDDEPEAQQLFQRMLAASRRRYRVLRAADGRHALNLARERRPDVILLDLAMPEMDGFRFLQMRGEEPTLRDTPVVVISARDPTGQPVLSNALAVSRGGGVSTGQLLACIQAVSGILSAAGQSACPAPPGVRPG